MHTERVDSFTLKSGRGSLMCLTLFPRTLTSYKTNCQNWINERNCSRRLPPHQSLTLRTPLLNSRHAALRFPARRPWTHRTRHSGSQHTAIWLSKRCTQTYEDLKVPIRASLRTRIGYTKKDDGRIVFNKTSMSPRNMLYQFWRWVMSFFY